MVIRGEAHFFDDLGEGSNTRAEWLALLKAIEVARGLGIGGCELIGDCHGVIDQASGAAKVRDAAGRAGMARLAELAVDAPLPRIRWIRRAQNLAGIALERRRAGR